MAGPAIRALEIGKRLATEFPTTVLSPVKSEGSFAAAQNLPAGMKLVQGAGKKLVAQLALSATAIFVQANVLKPFPFLASMGKP